MANRRAVAESPLSSQSSSILSGPSSDDGEERAKMTKSKRGTRVIGDSDDADSGSKPSIESGFATADEDDGAEVESGAEDGEEDEDEDEDDDEDGQDDDDEEEADELDDEEEEEEEGVKARGASAGRTRRAAVQSKRLPVTKKRDVPTRRAATASTSRIARAQRFVDEEEEDDEMEDEDELDDSASEEGGSEAQTTPNSSRSKRITLRLSSAAKTEATSAAAKRKRGSSTKGSGKRKKPAKRAGAGRSALQDESEGGEEEAAEQEASSEDFENENTFASLPKTARQLAKERAAQGLASPEGSDALEAVEDGQGGDDGAKKQQMTESEIALKRSEMARRRRNQTEKKLEDDKIETINRLLKKQVSRRHTRAAADGDESDGDNDEDGAVGANGVEKRSSTHLTPMQKKQQPLPFYRYISSANGSTLSLPVEDLSSAPYKEKWNAIFNVKDTPSIETATT